jgi:citrate synthase
VDGVEPLQLDVVATTEGAPGADISRLLGSTGLVTFDPGFANTAACTSAITYIDGDAGILRYRGYPIEDLAGTVDFLEVS